mmetsp:Transcript_26511/g.74095  ORF Transcript_26511/g.74095 Transcript_26511/m.74095 type:complete len:249 (-) Transcript_26511:407-1153(-)
MGRKAAEPLRKRHHHHKRVGVINSTLLLLISNTRPQIGLVVAKDAFLPSLMVFQRHGSVDIDVPQTKPLLGVNHLLQPGELLFGRGFLIGDKTFAIQLRQVEQVIHGVLALGKYLRVHGFGQPCLLRHALLVVPRTEHEVGEYHNRTTSQFANADTRGSEDIPVHLESVLHLLGDFEAAGAIHHNDQHAEVVHQFVRRNGRAHMLGVLGAFSEAGRIAHEVVVITQEGRLLRSRAPGIRDMVVPGLPE